MLISGENEELVRKINKFKEKEEGYLKKIYFLEEKMKEFSNKNRKLLVEKQNCLEEYIERYEKLIEEN